MDQGGVLDGVENGLHRIRPPAARSRRTAGPEDGRRSSAVGSWGRNSRLVIRSRKAASWPARPPSGQKRRRRQPQPSATRWNKPSTVSWDCPLHPGRDNGAPRTAFAFSEIIVPSPFLISSGPARHNATLRSLLRVTTIYSGAKKHTIYCRLFPSCQYLAEERGGLFYSARKNFHPLGHRRLLRLAAGRGAEDGGKQPFFLRFRRLYSGLFSPFQGKASETPSFQQSPQRLAVEEFCTLST